MKGGGKAKGASSSHKQNGNRGGGSGGNGGSNTAASSERERMLKIKLKNLRLKEKNRQLKHQQNNHKNNNSNYKNNRGMWGWMRTILMEVLLRPGWSVAAGFLRILFFLVALKFLLPIGIQYFAPNTEEHVKNIYREHR